MANKHKRANKIYANHAQVLTFENLLKAYFVCLRGKRFREKTVKFQRHYLENLYKLLKILQNGEYEVVGLYKFIIYEPKMREIIANEFVDKIVQNAICVNILEPVLQSRLIYDNYASQEGKGSSLALNRLEHFMLSYTSTVTDHTDAGHVLSGDIHHYFYEIDREILFHMINGLPIDLECKEILFTIITSIEKFDGSEKGLCIGYQTSQWLAVYYLDGLDHFIKEQLHIKYYGRYMDDFYLIHESRKYLEYCEHEIDKYITTRLNLKLNPKTNIHPFSQGIVFLGYHYYYNARFNKVDKVIRTKNINRMLSRTHKQKKLMDRNIIDIQHAMDSLQSWEAYTHFGKTNKSKNSKNKALNIINKNNRDLAYLRNSLSPSELDEDGFIILKHTDQYSEKHDGHPTLVKKKKTKEDNDNERIYAKKTRAKHKLVTKTKNKIHIINNILDM